MTRFAIDVQIMPRPSLLDPQGQAVEHALTALGFSGVADVRVGRALTLYVDRADAEAAERDAHAMCERLFANPVTEGFDFSVREAN